MNNDLISREALKRLIEDKIDHIPVDDYDEGWNGALYATIELIDNAPTVEPRIEYGTDGQPYRLFMTGGQVVPDTLQGWRYEEKPQGGRDNETNN